MRNVVKDDMFFTEGGNTPEKLLEEMSKFTSPTSGSKASGSSPSRWFALSDMADKLVSFDNELGILPVS